MAVRCALCFFASDLHGKLHRYEALLSAIRNERPRFVLLGGDLLPFHGFISEDWKGDFFREYLFPRLEDLRRDLREEYPQFFVILGNDDPAIEQSAVAEAAQAGLWTYLHNAKFTIDGVTFWGYAFVPPTPFRMKDWEKYDVSRYVDPGCVDPMEGWHTTPFSESEMKYATIEKDLKLLTGSEDLTDSIFLFHTPPHNTKLDRAALDGKTIDHAPLDLHVGSIAVRRFIEARQPLLTLHGHIHESARITGSWKDRLGRTWLFSAAHDGPELSLIRFKVNELEAATRELL